MTSRRIEISYALTLPPMSKFTPIIFLLVLALIPATLNAQQRATTEDGKKVILKEDGTWEYSGKDARTKPKNSGRKDQEKERKEPDASNGPKTVFRDTRWGMSQDKVKKTEDSEPISKDERSLVYEVDPVAGLPMVVGYIFVEDKLVRARYVSTEKHSNNNMYITDFRTLKKALKNKYGSPKSDDNYWSKDLYRDDRSEWGTAVSVGHLKYFTTWETPETEITLSLTGDNFEVTLVIEYVSKKLKNLQKEKVNESTSEAL